MWGQACKVAISSERGKDSGVSLTEKEVLKHCNEHLEPFMIPKVVRFIAQLPKTPNGKVDRQKLKDLE